MRKAEILPRALAQIEEIHAFTAGRWGEDQANRYINGMFDAIERLVVQITPSRTIPAVFGFDGYFFRYERHFLYWRYNAEGNISILTVTHEKQNQTRALRDVLSP